MTALASGLATGATGCELGPIRDPSSRALRVAHLTDIHVGPSAGAEGMAAALRQVHSLADPPDLLLNGGDCILDALAADRADTAAQWAVWRAVLDAELALPIAHCIGNHDVWGWARGEPEIEQDPLYGKAWAMQELGLASRYYGFDVAGWHFVVLDSTGAVDGLGYEARLDEEQWQWLVAELAATPSSTPVCLLSHVPILCACAFFDGANEASGDWQVPSAWMHIDARRIKDLLALHENVRLCLSGHSHLQDRVEYLGVTYLCNGAVSGAWWQGAYQEFGPAYALIDLYPDGSFDAAMVRVGG
jgi:3',5'-cyclic AMP phosphodiesterase CpdA